MENQIHAIVLKVDRAIKEDFNQWMKNLDPKNVHSDLNHVIQITKVMTTIQGSKYYAVITLYFETEHFTESPIEIIGLNKRWPTELQNKKIKILLGEHGTIGPIESGSSEEF